jgi:hypothetical protein
MLLYVALAISAMFLRNFFVFAEPETSRAVEPVFGKNRK